MSTLFKKPLTRSLLLLAVFGMCACAAQSYYSSSSYAARRPTPYRANPYRRVGSSTYRDYNREYYEALRQRRLRALADSYKGIYNRVSTSSNNGGSTQAQRLYSTSRLPAAAAAISAVSNDGSSSTTTTSIYASSNNNPKNDYYTSNNSLTGSSISVTSANKQQDATAITSKQRISKADQENAKFAGLRNQEADEESSKTVSKLKLNKFRRCFPFGRDAQGDEVTPPPEEQGRILWDLNIYNIYSGGGYAPPPYGGGCGGLGGGLASAFAGAGGLGGLGGLGGFGGLGGGGLLSDPIAAAYAPPNRLNNFLQLFAPGILQNALAATARPSLLRPQADTSASEANDLANDPEVDPEYNAIAARPPPVRRPNRVYYDSAGAAPITPAQLVGGVATTVNGIIQQLTGNVLPVYPSYRSQSYGK
ncbi:PE-PGRS family protein PE_PGRS17 [Anastrepha obliqua]|uniref:PE-PGRS family protein PE_PGRS17 n=1 Tax=Anastrepha obliqua TaxID=95512 RepID=UPI0024092B9C|nr:PE-PGRS family protein PE_PGRS17 [Anastrepha obliqua]